MAELRIREVQTRIFVSPDRLQSAVTNYKALTGGICSLHIWSPIR
jgi:hypothetical protein